MNCPICGNKLEHDGIFGRLFSHQDGFIAGDIWKCPNGAEQDGSCDSEFFHVAGSFYTFRDKEDEIHEGYPC